MKIITQKEMNAILARFDELETRFDTLETKVDKIAEDLKEFKHETKLELTKISCSADKSEVRFNCMSLIVSTLLTILVLGGGTYLVNMNNNNSQDLSEIRKELETLRHSN